MGRGGQNRLPDKVKKLRGTLDKRTAGSGVDLKACAVPRAPAGLTPGHRRVWRDLARQVEALGVYTPADYSAFKLMVQCVSLAEEWSEKTGPGRPPATALTRLIASAAATLTSFGLTPASRGRVQLPVEGLDADTDRDLFGPSLALLVEPK